MSTFSPSPEDTTDTTDRYQILGEIARGGMGVVYRVKDIDMDRVVAMKVLSQMSKATTADAQTDFYTRFLEEVQVTAQLDHPAIVPVHEVGFQGDGTPYYTMRYVKGQHLGDIIALAQKGDQSWTLARLIEVLVKVCQALAHAHGKGVLHRDLKPTNIMVGDLGEVYVMDWGLARMLLHEGARDLRMGLRNSDGLEAISALVSADPGASIDHPLRTADGTVVGTPAYMPPEQAEGRMDEVDHLSDIYSLGAILYHMLAGHPPYMPNDNGTTAIDVLKELRTHPPARILRRDAKLPPELLAICDKAMTRVRSERYSSALSLAEDLQAYLDGRVVKAHRTGPVIELKKWIQRHRATASLVTFALLVGCTGILWQWQEARSERDEARWQSYRAFMMNASNAVHLNQQEQLRSALDSAPHEFRNWEWDYFSQMLDPSLATFPITQPIHVDQTKILLNTDGRLGLTRTKPSLAPSTIWTIASGETQHLPHDQVFSEDLSLAAGYGSDGPLIVSDIKSGKTVLRVPLRSDTLPNQFEFAGNDDYLVVRWTDRIAVWNLNSGRSVEIGSSEKWYAHQVHVLPRAQRIFVVWSPFLMIYHLETGREISRIRMDKNVCTGAISPDESIVALGELFPDDDIQLWRARDGQRIGRLEGHTNSVPYLRFDPSGSRLLSGSVDRTARLWNLSTQREIATLRHRGVVWSVAFNHNGTLAATAAADGTVRLWDGNTGEPLNALRGHQFAPFTVAFSPNDERLASADRNEIKIWSTAKASLGVLHGHEGVVYDVAISPDGRHAASAAWDKTVRIWDLATGLEDQKILMGPGVAIGVAYSPDGQYLAATTRDSLRWWDVSAARQVGHVALTGNVVAQSLSLTPTFSPESKRVMIVLGSVVRIWDVQTCEIVAEISLEPDLVNDAEFHPGGHQLASVGPDNTVHLWNARSFEPVGDLVIAGEGTLYTVSYSPKGNLLAAAGEGKGVVVWDTETHEELGLLPHSGSVYCLAFSPDGERLFTACDDGLIRIWDLTFFEQVGSLHGHESFVHGVVMSADGRLLVSGGGDKVLRLWPIAPLSR